VLDITMRSTVLRMASGAKTVVPNSILSNSYITNWSTGMERRRVDMMLDFEYGSPRAKIEGFIEDLRGVLESDPDTDQTDAAVRFYDFGAYSLKVKVLYYVRQPKYLDYLRIRERVNFRIVELAEEHGLVFAFPTQTLEFSKEELEGGKNAFQTIDK